MNCLLGFWVVFIVMGVELEYRGKYVFVLMVWVGGFLFCMLVVEYGVDIIYGEEIVDYKMVCCVCVVNEDFGMVDFVEKSSNEVVFCICDEEKYCVVF